MALQPQLGAVPERWPRPDFADRRHSHVDESVLTEGQASMIRKLKSGEFRLYSRKKNPQTGKRRNLGTFATLEKAKEHERAVQYFKRH